MRRQDQARSSPLRYSLLPLHDINFQNYLAALVAVILSKNVIAGVMTEYAHQMRNLVSSNPDFAEEN